MIMMAGLKFWIGHLISLNHNVISNLFFIFFISNTCWFFKQMCFVGLWDWSELWELGIMMIFIFMHILIVSFIIFLLFSTILASSWEVWKQLYLPHICKRFVFGFFFFFFRDQMNMKCSFPSYICDSMLIHVLFFSWFCSLAWREMIIL